MINNNTQKLGRRQTCAQNKRKWQKKFIKNYKKKTENNQVVWFRPA